MPHMPTPRHEPEVIAAEARRKWHGDSEKVRTTSITSMQVAGVALSSRYDKADEYDVMVAMVDVLAPDLRPFIVSIFCDSKATACYAVELRPCTDDQAEEIGRQIEHACIEQQGGHNGILLTRIDGRSVFVNPDWSDH